MRKFKFITTGLLSLACLSVHAESINTSIDTESPQVETNFTPSSSCWEYGSVGGGSLVAQNTGLTGYGFTQDIMYWPEACSEPMAYKTMTFQVSVHPDYCPYVGVAWDRPETFKVLPVNWKTGVLLGKGNEITTNMHAFRNSGKWFELVIGDTGYLSNATPIAAACGYSEGEAMNNALTIARSN